MEAAGLNAGDYVTIRLLDNGDVRVRPYRKIRLAEQPGLADTDGTTGKAGKIKIMAATW